MNPKMNVNLPNHIAKQIIQFATNENMISKYFNKNGEGRQFCELNKFIDLDLTNEIKIFAKHAYEQIGVPHFIE